MPLADAFVADLATVQRIDGNTQPTRDLDAEDVKGIDVVKLGQLRAMLAAKAFVDVLPEFPEVHAVSDDGPWVFEVSPQLVATIAAMDESQVIRAAEQWWRIEEFKLDGFDLPTVIAVLRTFVNVARRARSQSKAVYLWCCL